MGEHVYATAAWPMWAALVGGALVVALLGWLLVLAYRERPGAVVVAPMAAGLATGAIGSAYVHPGRFSSDVARVFRTPLLADTLAVAVGCGAFFAVVVVLVKLGKVRRVLTAGLITLAGALALYSGARSHARSLLRFSELPFFVLRGRNDLHVGHERDVEVALARAPRRYWLFGEEQGPQILDEAYQRIWHGPRTIHARAAAAGGFSITAEAQSGPVRVRSTLWLEGKREIANPMLPLRVGNRWVYEVVTAQNEGRVFYFAKTGGGQSRSRFELEVVGTGERDGFRTFTIAARGDDLWGTSEVVALEGKTLTIDEHGNLGEPAIERIEPIDTNSRVTCRIPLLGLEGRCQDGGADVDEPATAPAEPHREEPEPVAVPARFALAGPLWFRRSNITTADKVATGLLAVVTVGLLITPHGSTTSFALVETHRGPAGAPEAQ